MPRLSKVDPTTTKIAITYDRNLHGFFLGGNLEQGDIRETLRQKGRAVPGPDGDVLWWVPEIYWKTALNIAQRLRQPACLKGMEQFQANLVINKYPGTLSGLTSLGTKLRPYQVEACRMLMTGNLLLGYDVGLGKTLTCLYAFDIMRRFQDSGYKLVVFTPNDDVSDEWVNERRKHFGETGSLVISSRRDLEKRAEVTLVSYSKTFRTDYTDYLYQLCEQPKTILILDEAHRVSAVTSHQHRAAFEYACLADRVWLLTGSEVRDPTQYYGLYKIVNRLPREARVNEEMWTKHYKNKERRGWDEGRLKELHVLRRSFAIKRTKEQVCKEIPPLTWVSKPVAMHPLQRQMYRKMEEDQEATILAEWGNKEMSETHFLTVYLRLMQMASHPLLLEETRIGATPKSEALMDILQDVGEQKVLIWSNWPKTIDFIYDQITKHHPDLKVAKAHGGVSKADRAVAKGDLQAGDLDVLIANPCVFGEGVNLQAASVVIYYDYHPSSTRWVQSIGRAHRMGQTKPVTAVKLYHSNSIETKILDWLESKKRLSAIITGG